MADTRAIAVFESVYRRTDQQIRDILATYTPAAEVDTINVILGDGVTPLVAGVGAVIRVDFEARITGCFLQEFDGTAGSVVIQVQSAQGGDSPVWGPISPPGSPAIVTGRYFADEQVADWGTYVNRGDYLRFLIASASGPMARIHVGLRLRRLEP